MRPYQTTCPECHTTYTVTCTTFKCPNCLGKGWRGGPLNPNFGFPY